MHTILMLIIQAFMLPLTHAGAVRRVVLVYKDWLQVCTHPMYALKFVFVVCQRANQIKNFDSAC